MLDRDVSVLYDDWIYHETTHCTHGNEFQKTAFGVTADMLMTGLWYYGAEAARRDIVQRLLNCYLKASANRPMLITCFARHGDFKAWYTERLSLDLGLVGSQTSDELLCGCSAGPRFLFNKACSTMIKSQISEQHRVLALQYPIDDLDNALERAKHGHVWDPASLSRFSSDSTHGLLTLDLEATPRVFWKQSKYNVAEVQGSMLAADYFPLTQRPLVTSSGYLLCPEFLGKTQADWRYGYCSGEIDGSIAIPVILDAELRKAEDAPAAYVASYGKSSGCDRPLVNRPLYDRVAMEGTRLAEMYPGGIDVQDQRLALHQIMSASLSINGRSYLSLRSILSHSLARLDTQHCAMGPIVFGLGDAHGGNIMIADELNGRSYRDLLYIDYEVSGFHPLLLDLAKPLYNDVFFSTLMGDSLAMPGTFTCIYRDGAVIMTLDRCIDDLGEAILEIKKRHLIEPIRAYMTTEEVALDEFVPCLAHASLACALFTRDYTGHWETLWRNVCIGVVLSQVKDFDGLWEEFDGLVRTRHRH